jgi:hypothetical protein
MKRPHAFTPDGTPVDLIGQPLGHRAAPGVGVRIVTTGETAMAKADANGVYVTQNGGRFKIRKGDPLPEGAELATEPNKAFADLSEDELRAKKAAPQNRSKGSAPENRSEG